MQTDYFEETRTILPITRFEIDKVTYCDVSISQYWSSVYRNVSSCGVEETRTWRRKTGWSKEYSTAFEAELGFSLSIGLASLSPKISTKINKTINLSMEEEEEHVTKFTAPKCGKHEIGIYQLKSEWHIKFFRNKKRLLRKPLVIEYNSLTYMIGESEWTESNNIYQLLPNCNCSEKAEYDGNVTLGINNGVINLPCQRLGNTIIIYGIKDRLISQGEFLKFQELPIEISKHLHSSSEAKVLTYGEKMPIVDGLELIDKFELLALQAKKIILNAFDQDYRTTISSIFKNAGDHLIENLSDLFQLLKNYLVEDGEKLRSMKRSLDRLRHGDLSELSDQLKTLYDLFNEIIAKPLLDIWGNWFIGGNNDEVTELYDQLNKFYESFKEIIIIFLTKSADLLFRLVDLNNTQEAILMAKEFIVSSENQFLKFKNRALELLQSDVTKML